MATLKYLLKSLYSNQTIIDGRKKRWYWAIMFFVLSCVLMVIPVLSKGYTSSGTVILDPANDNGVVQGLYQLAKNDSFKDLYIGNDANGTGTLKTEKKADTLLDQSNPDSFVNSPFYASTNIDTKNPSGSQPVKPDDGFVFNITVSGKDGVQQTVPALTVYSTNLNPLVSAQATQLSDVINKKIFLQGTEYETKIVRRSFLLFTPTEFFLYSFAPLPTAPTTNDTTNTSGSATESYASSSMTPTVFTGTFESFSNLYDANGKYSFASLEVTEPLAIDNANVIKAWGPFFQTAYVPLRDRQTWTTFGIVLGGTAGAILLMGLMIFLFSLGRRNLLHKDCTLWQGLKMGATLSFTCALIGMIAYFFQPTYGLMFGAMALILRTMWLIMKTSGGGYSGKENKPLYQARD